jgi:pyridine nucleotide-disulfide oxidoreductase
MSELVDTTIVGAGPYGLSLAAHLRAAGVRFRHFGLPMYLWRNAMPRGMYLKSQGFASNLSDPYGACTLESFCRNAGIEYRDYGLPVSLDTFVAYGEWFGRNQVPGLEERLVTRIAPAGRHFEVEVAGGETVRSRRVVCAAGVQHFAYLPGILSPLPPEICTHSSAHTDLDIFAGRTVVVLGAGQSALETAALLHEAGASVRLVARTHRLAWNGTPLAPDRPLWAKLREPEAGLGSGWGTWFYSTQPQAFWRLPQSTRIRRARTALGPAGAWWLRSRADGPFPVQPGNNLVRAQQIDGGVRLRLRDDEDRVTVLDAEHVIAATGFRPDVDRLAFMAPELRAQLRRVGGGPRVGRDFQSSVPGLYFAGPAVVSSFGPVMRFVYGADFAARTLSRALVDTSRSPRPVTVGASQ